MYGEIVRALREGTAQPLSDWLSAHGVDTEELWRLPRWNTDAALDREPGSRRPPDRTALVRRVVSEQLPRVEGEPCGTALLLLAITGYVEDAWETTYHFGPLWDTLRESRAVVLRRGMPSDAAEAGVLRAVLARMECLDRSITAENMMSGVLPEAHVRASRAAADAAEAGTVLPPTALRTCPELAAYLADGAAEELDYHRAVATAVQGVIDFLRSGAPLDAAIAELAAAEQRISSHGNILTSELRAHRFSLQALRDKADAPWLRVEHGKLVHVFPFAVRGAETSEVVAAVRREADGWRPAGVAPEQVHSSLHLNDAWHGADSLGRRYEGASVELPAVVLRGLDGADICRFSAELRFSELGNHYVRFTAELWDASPADIYALMCHVAPKFGACRAGFDAPPAEGREARTFPRLADVAMEVIGSVAEALRASPPTAGAWVIARPGMSQVVLTVDSASVTRGPAPHGARREIRTIEELTGAMGTQVLTNPVSHLIGATAEWSRFPTDHAMVRTSTLVHGVLLARTPNTTLLAALGTADFSNGTRGTTAEFAASLDGLFAGWLAELAEHYATIARLRRRLPEPGTGDGLRADELDELSQALDDEKVRLDNFAIETRAAVMILQSPSLLSSPVTAELLRLLLEGSDFQRRSEELRAQTDEVANERLGILLDKLASRRAAQQRTKLDVLLAVITAAGVSGVIQVLQTGLGDGGTAAAWAIVGVSVIVLGAVGLGYWAARSIGRAP